MDLYWQEPEVRLLTSLLPYLERRSVIDVGAERGALAERFLSGGADEVHVVEAEPANVSVLRERFAGDARVVVHAYAVSDRDTQLTLHKAVDAAGAPVPYGHTVLERPGTGEIAWNETITVEARSLASLIETGDLPERVGVLKIDIEGHDLAAVRGTGRLDADVVMVEHWTDLPNSLGPCPWRAADMVEALRPRGFSHFVLVLHRGEWALFKWDDPDVPEGEFGNLVFLHDRIVEHVWPEVVNCATACAEAALEQLAQENHERLVVINKLHAESEARLETIEQLKAQIEAEH
jgi:FkbM family methyltransferase